MMPKQIRVLWISVTQYRNIITLIFMVHYSYMVYLLVFDASHHSKASCTIYRPINLAVLLIQKGVGKKNTSDEILKQNVQSVKKQTSDEMNTIRFNFKNFSMPNFEIQRTLCLSERVRYRRLGKDRIKKNKWVYAGGKIEKKN